MKHFLIIFILLSLFSCNQEIEEEKGIDLDIINSLPINEDVNYGVVNLPQDSGVEIMKFFDKYTRVIAENGKFIHLFAPNAVSYYELARIREILIGLLKNHEDGIQGISKEEISNYLADQNSCLMLFNTVEDLKRASEGALLVSPISIHPFLYENIITEGSADFLSTSDVDKSLAKTLRMVLKSGIANTKIGYNSEIYNAANTAKINSIWTPSNEDTLLALGDIGISYLSTILEVYYGYWAEQGIVNNGEYLYSNRNDLQNDATGISAIESFFQTYIPYKIILDPNFNGDFTCSFDIQINYTLKSQYYSNVDASYSNCLNITGNQYPNHFKGNSLDNSFEGKEDSDIIDGMDGFDISIYTGNRNEYLIFNSNDGLVIVQDTISNRDGLDSLYNIERLQFQDINLDL